MKVNEERLGVLNRLIAQSAGVSLRKLLRPETLLNSEICTEILVFRYMEFRVGTCVENIVSLFFGSGPSVAEQCEWELHFDLGADGRVLRIDVPDVSSEDGSIVRRSHEYDPATTEAWKFESLVQEIDRLLATAAQGKKVAMPENHAKNRMVSVEKRGR